MVPYDEFGDFYFPKEHLTIKPQTDISGHEPLERSCEACGKKFKSLKPASYCNGLCADDWRGTFLNGKAREKFGVEVKLAEPMRFLPIKDKSRW